MDKSTSEASARSETSTAAETSSAADSGELTTDFLEAAEKGGLAAAYEKAAPAKEVKASAAEEESTETKEEEVAEEKIPAETESKETEETAEEKDPEKSEESEEEPAPKRPRMDQEHFSELDRKAAVLVKTGAFKSMKEAITHLEKQATPEVAKAPVATIPEVEVLETAKKKVETAKADAIEIRKQLKEAIKSYDAEKQSELTEKALAAERAIFDAEREVERAEQGFQTANKWHTEFNASAQRAMTEWPEAKDSKSPLGKMVTGMLASLTPDDPLFNDPDQAFKCTEEAAKILNIAGKSAASKEVEKAKPAEVKAAPKSPQLKKPAPAPGSARTVVPQKNSEEEYKGRLAGMLGSDAAMADAL